LRELALQAQLHVYYYGGNETDQTSKIDKGFGQEVKWDVPLLEGYGYTFLNNLSPSKSMSTGFFDAVNFDIFGVLKNLKSEIIILNGWSYLSDWFVLIAAKLFGHKVWMRAEMPWNQELMKPRSFKRYIKFWLFKNLIFKYFVDRFLFIGEQNRRYYQNHGVPQDKLIFAPYAVDNDRFAVQKSINKLVDRQKFGIKPEQLVILYSGKLIEKKRPLDLLRAFHILKNNNAVLFFLGEGPLRDKITNEVENLKIENVIISGFVNQSEIGRIYNMADIFVMCSGVGETWGLSINEAMNLGLPILVSETCGSALDLVENDKNGYIFGEGSVSELKKYLEILCNDGQLRKRFGDFSMNKILRYSHLETVKNILSAK
jgi:glycosyltransferase involved in cell wall biosynthesis